ncbi:MAG: protein kinase [Spirochaetes bacterium]|nr:protein kinase [Spirochaetota bacterium]
MINLELDNVKINDVYIVHKMVTEDPFGVVWNSRAYFAANHFDLQFLKIPKSKISKADLGLLNNLIMKIYSINHPTLMNIIEIGEYEESLYIVTQEKEKISLSDLMDHTEDLSEEHALDIVIKIGEALKYLHNQEIYHNDLNPRNILINEETIENPAINITNFSYPILKKYIHLKSKKDITDFYGYLPPEHLMDKKIPDNNHSDLYGLGALLFFLITGKPPYSGGSINQLKQKKQDTKLDFSTRSGKKVSPALQKFFHKVLHPDVTKRIIHINDMLKTLYQLKKKESLTLVKEDLVEKEKPEEGTGESLQKQEQEVNQGEVKQSKKEKEALSKGNPLVEEDKKQVRKYDKETPDLDMIDIQFKQVVIKYNKVIQNIVQLINRTLDKTGNICFISTNEKRFLNEIFNEAKKQVKDFQGSQIEIQLEKLASEEKDEDSLLIEKILDRFFTTVSINDENETKFKKMLDEMNLIFPQYISKYQNFFPGIKIKKGKKKKQKNITIDEQKKLLYLICELQSSFFILIENIEYLNLDEQELINSLTDEIINQPILIICTYDPEEISKDQTIFSFINK